MRKIYQLIAMTILAAVVVACGGGATEENPDLTAKKAKLDSLKTVFADVKEQMNVLEGEIAELDPNMKSSDILVATMVPGKKEFKHFVELRGTVKSRKDVLLSAEAMGVVKTVNVREGDKVSKGQLLVALDADVLSSSLNEVKTQLELAESVFNRQQKLWDQKIGTEIQYLQAKSNYESLKSRKAQLEAQLSQARLRAPFSGTIDMVNVKLGEMVQPGTPLVRLVNPGEMHIMSDVSEEYLGMFSKGDEVTVQIPGKEGKFKSKVRSVSNVLNVNNRTFSMEVTLPSSGDFEFKPNQVAIVKIADYTAQDAIVVPSRIILAGKEGQFVYGLKTIAGEQKAAKIPVKVGQSAGSSSEIISGLTGKEQIIVEGYREVSDGAGVRLAQDVASK